MRNLPYTHLYTVIHMNVNIRCTIDYVGSEDETNPQRTMGDLFRQEKYIIRGIYTLYYEGKESGYNDTIYNFNNNRATVGIIHGTHHQCWGCNRNYTMQ